MARSATQTQRHALPCRKNCAHMVVSATRHAQKVGDSQNRGKACCKKTLWSEKQPVKVQSRSTARIDRRSTQLRAHLRASTQEQCAPNTGHKRHEDVFPRSRIWAYVCLVGGDNSHQGKPFTTRTAPSKVRMARGNAIKMPIQAASATHRDRKPLAAIELFSTLLREEEEKGETSSTPS